jgi:hypothetical protein
MTALLLAIIVIMSCVLTGAEELSDDEKLQTVVAQTLTAMTGNTVDQTDETAEPTITIEPVDTESGPPTPTPEPCNRAAFVSETIEDGTDFDPNESFTKTWRFKNTGTCTWNANYKMVFVQGDQLSGPATKNLTQSVAPGESVDLSVNLKAPASEGAYKGFWKVADDEGQYFVHNIWVEIEVIDPGLVVVLKPDLKVTEFTITPATPKSGVSMHTLVKVKNSGGSDAGAFKVQWYGLSTFTNPSCDWNVAGGLAKGATKTLECNFTFSSWYPINKTSIVNVDVNNSVNETNEGNNSATISPFGVES